MTPFTRTVFFTPVLNRVTIKWDGKRLSITGQCRDRGTFYGQCRDEILAKYPAPAVRLLCHYWKRWHCNDMRSGLPIQHDFLDACPVKKDHDWYDNACAALKAVGLYEVDGYKFGHEWKREDVPEHVLVWLRDAKIY